MVAMLLFELRAREKEGFGTSVAFCGKKRRGGVMVTFFR